MIMRLFRSFFAGVCASLAAGAVLPAHPLDPALVPAMIQALSEELTKTPETDLFIQRGELYAHRQEWAKAEADFAAAAQRDPQRLSIAFQRAHALLKMGQPARARPLMDHYLTQKLSQPEAWFLRGEILAALGEADLARADYAEGFQRAPAAGPEQIATWAQLVAQLPNGQADALAIVDQAVARLGPSAFLLNYAIDLEVARKHYDGALARIDGLLQKTGWPGLLLIRRGDVLAQAGRSVDAVAAYRAALAAIDKLPARNRQGADMQKLARNARTALARLPAN
jgi:predicted Zn-dependent protease